MYSYIYTCYIYLYIYIFFCIHSQKYRHKNNSRPAKFQLVYYILQKRLEKTPRPNIDIQI